MEKLEQQLRSVLPVNRAEYETYRLVAGRPDDENSPSLFYSRSQSTGQNVVRIPLAATMLPGWTVQGWWLGGEGGSLGRGVFFTLTGVLVACFVGAILVGGGLLMREARRSELEAQQKTSFVANISHELKTPLTTIRMYAELLEQGRVTTEAKQRDYLGVIGRESARLSRLIGNALDFSRLEQGRKTYTLQEVELIAGLDQLLTSQGPVHPLRIRTDFDAVQQVVLNLIDNACKYAASGGELAVAVRGGAGQGVELEVSDRGPGVAPASHQRIFEKFHREDDRLTAEQGGAGLGLGIARQLARGLGGDLICRSREGGGASFIIRLP